MILSPSLSHSAVADLYHRCILSSTAHPNPQIGQTLIDALSSSYSATSLDHGARWTRDPEFRADVRRAAYILHGREMISWVKEEAEGEDRGKEIVDVGVGFIRRAEMIRAGAPQDHGAEEGGIMNDTLKWTALDIS